MAGNTHYYEVTIEWTGNLGQGTTDYKSYSRNHTISALEKPPILGSSDPSFKGDANRWNPEDMLVASLSACHKLWYLNLCAIAGVVVTAYEDAATGVMVEDAQRGGYFTDVVLHPKVTITDGSSEDLALRLHHQAHEKCFIANSVNFPVRCEPKIMIG
ncbi:MAG: OsmC family protein [Alphaproteobacteria bacterium]|nr:OsmC family protein [Alphaproteobacteria bacterium]